jgi:hypothetical protein
MSTDRRSRSIFSGTVSGLATACVHYLSGGSRVTSGSIFLGIIMILSGWTVLFNLLAIWVGRPNEVHCAEYDIEGAHAARMMSPRLTNIVCAAFWLNSCLMMMVELNT